MTEAPARGLVRPQDRGSRDQPSSAGRRAECAGRAAGAKRIRQRQIAIGMLNDVRSGKLLKIFWHDGIGASLYAKRLERGRFVWPTTSGEVVVITPGQLGYLLEGI